MAPPATDGTGMSRPAPRSGLFFAGLLVLLITACDGSANGTEETVMPEKTIDAVLATHTDALMSLPGVAGIAQGLCEGKPCIKVYVIDKTPQLEQDIPTTLGGYPVVIEKTGEIRALPDD
jgi:hypothetical protein